MDKNRISIIIPVYNAEDYIARCVESIIEQDFTSFEVILVDDGSTDSSPLICDRYSATDSRFKTVHKANGGVSSARNAGINLAKGEYLMFVDSDDVLLPKALSSMCDGLSDEDFVLGGYLKYVEDIPQRETFPKGNRKYHSGEMAAFFDDNILKNCEMLDAPWAKLYRRRTLGKLRFCEELSYAEDKLFVFGFLGLCSSAMTCSCAVYGYYMRTGSLGSDIFSDRHLMQLRRFLPEYAGTLNCLTARYPDSLRLGELYHKDMVGRYVCRILNIFAVRKTDVLTQDYIAWLYALMDGDPRLGILSVRAGQVINILLYKIGNTRFSVAFYRMISGLGSVLSRFCPDRFSGG